MLDKKKKAHKSKEVLFVVQVFSWVILFLFHNICKVIKTINNDQKKECDCGPTVRGISLSGGRGPSVPTLQSGHFVSLQKLETMPGVLTFPDFNTGAYTFFLLYLLLPPFL